MSSIKRLWWFLGILCVCSFSALLLVGSEIYRQAPPLPDLVIADDGRELFTLDTIQRGRQVWQSMGGQQLGSIWGHGAYLAPDWTADWLHREITHLLETWARRDHGDDFASLDNEQQAALKARLKQTLRTNTWDEETNTITVTADRADAIEAVSAYYVDLFGDAEELSVMREKHAIPENPVPDQARRELVPAFFFWTAWAAAAERPGMNITYTNNWPHEPRIDNRPSVANAMWSIASVILLLAAIAVMVWYYAASRREEELPEPPEQDPLRLLNVTPSMLAVHKYFYVVLALFMAQIALGVLTAHYAVEGQGLFGFPLADYLPYAVTRTWHTQIAIFWIATAWLATGLYMAPAISGHEPPGQKSGVNLLLGALVLVVVGSLFGEWLGVQQKLGLDQNFWFGHQGWEYVDLGRFWQILLFGGLLFWLVLVSRSLWPALKERSQRQPMIMMLFLSTIAIGLLYGTAFFWGKHTHLSMVTYWRWWIVHLWVEGFFEVFATVVIALIFTRLGLIRASLAAVAVLLATIIFLTGGILGTLHHLYFAGTPTSVLAIGAMFSALEVVPLVLIGYEAWENYRLSKRTEWMQRYKWPIYCFVAVAFWNLVGAGLLGFLINPPLSLYFLQALNTTAAHAHGALFGVYGMLGIGLMLFCMQASHAELRWDERIMKPAFWSLNIGLAMMVFMSLVPAGVYQAYHSLTTGFWYARSPEIVRGPVMEFLVWLRVPGDVVFAIGAFLLAWAVYRGWQQTRARQGATVLPRPATETL
ncbi:MAG: nitric-oxide reductase large subunit [Wenzhouxiangella sp.]